MAKKAKPEYSLNEYISGISLDEFEQNLTASLAEKESADFGSNLAVGSFDVTAFFKERYAELFDDITNSKKHLYYHRLDNLVILAQAGNKDAELDIMAYALKNWAPHKMLSRSNAFESVVDKDDIVQVILMATMSAIKGFDEGAKDEFSNFAGYLKYWVDAQVKNTAKNSAPIKFPKGKKRKDAETGEEYFLNDKGQRCNISYIYIDGFANGDDDDSFDLPDREDQYADFEQAEEDNDFVNRLLSWPNRVGEVLVEYYGIRTPADEKKTIAEVALKTGLTVKQVRTRLEKGKKAIMAMYPKLAALMTDDTENNGNAASA